MSSEEQFISLNNRIEEVLDRLLLLEEKVNNHINHPHAHKV
jgi:hypothetical protein